MRTRLLWWAGGLAVLTGLVYLMATADTGPADPTEVHGQQSHATVVFNSAVIVFREGLEAILIFAAVTASLLGANEARRKPGRRRRRRGLRRHDRDLVRRAGAARAPRPRSARAWRRSPASSPSPSCSWS